jgi:hypothetical protein
VDVLAQPDVIGQVPSHVIRIAVDRDLIGVPQPVAGEGVIVRRDIEEEPAEPETARTAAGEPKEVAGPEAASETTMRPRMIEVVMGVPTTRVMSNPAAVRMHVRRIGVSCAVTE